MGGFGDCLPSLRQKYSSILSRGDRPSVNICDTELSQKKWRKNMLKTMLKIGFWTTVGLTTGLVGIGLLAHLAESDYPLE